MKKHRKVYRYRPKTHSYKSALGIYARTGKLPSFDQLSKAARRIFGYNISRK